MLLRGFDEAISSGLAKKKIGESKKSDNNETLLSSLPPPRAAAPFDPFLGLSSHPQRKKKRTRLRKIVLWFN